MQDIFYWLITILIIALINVLLIKGNKYSYLFALPITVLIFITTYIFFRLDQLNLDNLFDKDIVLYMIAAISLVSSPAAISSIFFGYRDMENKYPSKIPFLIMFVIDILLIIPTLIFVAMMIAVLMDWFSSGGGIYFAFMFVEYIIAIPVAIICLLINCNIGYWLGTKIRIKKLKKNI